MFGQLPLVHPLSPAPGTRVYVTAGGVSADDPSSGPCSTGVPAIGTSVIRVVPDAFGVAFAGAAFLHAAQVHSPSKH